MSIRTLSSGVSGMQANQAAIDVIGNNIANVNTPGFKSSRVIFADLLYHTVSAGQAPATTGGQNPMQFGLGASLGAIETMFTQGALSSTDRATDLAIQGDGFFVLGNGSDRFYTRSGSLTLDATGALVDTVTGYRVQGATGDVVIPQGATTPANPTTTAVFGGNLDASQSAGATYPLTFSVYDSLGRTHALTATFTKNAAAGQWDWAVTESDPNIASLSGATGSIVFNGTGAVSSGATGTLGVTYAAGAGVTSPQNVTLDFGSASNLAPLTGYASASTASLATQNGYPAGALTSFNIGADGSIVGLYDNGRSSTLGQIQLASFTNPSGLVHEGQNLWSESVNSGAPGLGAPGTGGRGSLLPGAIESSNVDLAREFTELITAQRGFEASARIINVGDEILQTVVNIIQ
jgi:flagellar hook protein FlgE